MSHQQLRTVGTCKDILRKGNKHLNWIWTHLVTKSSRASPGSRPQNIQSRHIHIFSSFDSFSLRRLESQVSEKLTERTIRPIEFKSLLLQKLKRVFREL